MKMKDNIVLTPIFECCTDAEFAVILGHFKMQKEPPDWNKPLSPKVAITKWPSVGVCFVTYMRGTSSVCLCISRSSCLCASMYVRLCVKSFYPLLHLFVNLS